MRHNYIVTYKINCVHFFGENSTSTSFSSPHCEVTRFVLLGIWMFRCEIEDVSCLIVFILLKVL